MLVGDVRWAAHSLVGSSHSRQESFVVWSAAVGTTGCRMLGCRTLVSVSESARPRAVTAHPRRALRAQLCW